MQAGTDTMRVHTIATFVAVAAFSVSAQDLSTNIKVCGTAHNCFRCRAVSEVPTPLQPHDLSPIVSAFHPEPPDKLKFLICSSCFAGLGRSHASLKSPQCTLMFK